MRRYWGVLFAALALLSPVSAECQNCNNGGAGAAAAVAAASPAGLVDGAWGGGAGGWGGCINDRPALFGSEKPLGCCFRIEGDYLLWWFESNRIASPLIGNVVNPAVSSGFGGLSDPNVRILFGGENLNRGPYSGGRITMALDPSEKSPIGVEGSGFWFPGQGNNYYIASNNVANPLLGFGRTTPGGVEFALPYVGPGSFTAQTDLDLWNFDGNLTALLFRVDGLTVVGLFGGRYARLEESLLFRYAIFNSLASAFDRYETTNQFGGQFGFRAMVDVGPIRASLLSKLALGLVDQELSISGGTRTGLGTALPFGIYTGPTNIGTSDRNRFGFIQETNVNLNAQLLDSVNIGVGYSFFYWSEALRTGREVTRASFLAPGPVGRDRLFDDRPFWAHGLNFTFGVNF